MCVDAGRVQIGADPEAGPEGEARHDAAVHPEAAQDADQVPGAAVAQEQHEDHVGHLPESAPPARRRLGALKVKHAMMQCSILKLLKYADEVPGAAVAQEQHEDHVGHLPESAPPARRRLGLRQWLAGCRSTVLCQGTAGCHNTVYVKAQLCHNTFYFNSQQAVVTQFMLRHSRLS